MGLRNDLRAFERQFANVETSRSRLESRQYLTRMGPFPGHTVSSPLEIGYHATSTPRHSITQVPQPSPVLALVSTGAHPRSSKSHGGCGVSYLACFFARLLLAAGCA